MAATPGALVPWERVAAMGCSYAEAHTDGWTLRPDRCFTCQEELSIRDLGVRPCLWHTAPKPPGETCS